MAAPMPSLIELMQSLETGAVTARSLVESGLAKAADPAGEGKRIFIALDADWIRAQADEIDRARRAGRQASPFAGIPITIKDLFDVRGEVTRAGSRVFDENAPAAMDCPAVARLRAFGFIPFGRVNMTEFAYSGLGLNRNFGTPASPWDRATRRVPGGSSSGGAVSVAEGIVPATLGTDTGGSCRIPAAFCGIVGLKTTTYRVPRTGVVPLSTTLDSIGPLAGSVDCCAILDGILSGGDATVEAGFPASGLRLGALQNFVLDGLDLEVADAHERAVRRLVAAGASVERVTIPAINRLPEINRHGGYVGAQAWGFHRSYVEKAADRYDPWIISRFEAGKRQSAADFIALERHRSALLAEFEGATARLDALVWPTVAVIPPAIAPLEADADLQTQTNMKVLRNTALVNFLDRPAISLPCHRPGAAPVGLMLVGARGQDRRLLAIAKGLEPIVRGDSR
jgi:aspartyl-tRNA(Asn)/glutamyl-tRNA(Gln) amidotransferase subunit A